MTRGARSLATHTPSQRGWRARGGAAGGKRGAFFVSRQLSTHDGEGRRRTAKDDKGRRRTRRRSGGERRKKNRDTHLHDVDDEHYAPLRPDVAVALERGAARAAFEPPERAACAGGRSERERRERVAQRDVVREPAAAPPVRAAAGAHVVGAEPLAVGCTPEPAARTDPPEVDAAARDLHAAPRRAVAIERSGESSV